MQLALLGSKFVGVTVSTGAVSAQLHDDVTGLAPPDPAKVRVACGQGREEMLTDTVWPGASVPLEGVKTTPLWLLLADQVTLPPEVVVSASVTLHW